MGCSECCAQPLPENAGGKVGRNEQTPVLSQKTGPQVPVRCLKVKRFALPVSNYLGIHPRDWDGLGQARDSIGSIGFMRLLSSAIAIAPCMGLATWARGVWHVSFSLSIFYSV